MDWAPELGLSRCRSVVDPRNAGSANSGGVLWRCSKMQKINKGQVARSVRFDIATDKNEEFHTIFRNDVLPILKKQDGFRNELLFLDDQHVLAISVWNNLDSARKYESATYPQLDKTLRPVMVGKPTIETYQYDSLSTTV
jgi:heme-degrading monooxygenase HmoA